VLLRLASRLQTLRYFASSKQQLAPAVAEESLSVFSPLANRLGLWDLKWEIEDLAFRFLEPKTYHRIARLIDAKRVHRKGHLEHLRSTLQAGLATQGIVSNVFARSKHIYSIVKKMRGKSLDFDQVFDLQALRVVVPQVSDCYAALSWVHGQFQPMPQEFDDYIAKPKANGYQSLHTVVRDSHGRALEIQIRTHAMHEHAEYGVAAHWVYKEAGAKGYDGASASGHYEHKIAVLRQLLDWKQDLSTQTAMFDDRVYVLTPDAAVVELPRGGTPVDFAYSVHTGLGHRCRGAKVDGVLVPLYTPLKNGQTVEVLVAREVSGAQLQGPSRDWLNPELAFIASPRTRAKVRAWFNAQALEQTIARGREAVEKLLQREGKTAVNLEDLATRLEFQSAQALFESVGKEEFSLRHIEQLWRTPELTGPTPGQPQFKRSRSNARASGVLVEGVASLLTELAKCCKPAPPDLIRGFVSRGKGVSVHRAECANLLELARRHPERELEVDWGLNAADARPDGVLYSVDVSVEAQDRQGLLLEVTEIFAKEKLNVTGVQTQTIRGIAWMNLTVEVRDATRLDQIVAGVQNLTGVRRVWRK
jgi:GTP pyrophosphokinase